MSNSKISPDNKKDGTKKYFDNAFRGLYSSINKIEQKLDILMANKSRADKDKTEQDINIIDKFNNFYKLNVPSIIPNLTTRQLYSMVNLGWRMDQIVAISGYSEEQVRAKISNYIATLRGNNKC